MTTKTNNNLKYKKLNNLGKLPVWSLFDLYDSTHGSQISLDLNFIEKATKKFGKKYEGKIKSLNSINLYKPND